MRFICVLVDFRLCSRACAELGSFGQLCLVSAGNSILHLFLERACPVCFMGSMCDPQMINISENGLIEFGAFVYQTLGKTQTFTGGKGSAYHCWFPSWKILCDLGELRKKCLL